MPKVKKSTKGVNGESDDVAYVTHNPGFILESNSTARANISSVQTFNQTVSDSHNCSSVSQNISKKSNFRAKKLTKRSKTSLPVYENIPKYSKSNSPCQHKNKLGVESLARKTIKKYTRKEVPTSPTLFDSSRVIRPSSGVYDLADKGPQRKSSLQKPIVQRHVKLISILSCVVLLITIAFLTIAYGTDLLSCKMTVLEMARSRNDKQTYEETPIFTINSHLSETHFNFETDVVLKSTKDGRSKWLVIDFCQNQTVNDIVVSINTALSGTSGPGILAFVGTTKSTEKRENDIPGWNESSVECGNLITKQANSDKFSLKCRGPYEGQFLSLQMKIPPKSILLEITKIKVTLQEKMFSL